MQVIRFTGVYKSFNKGGLALKNVSFNIRKGEFVFVTGPSGAGKTTLLKLIHMELRPTDGEVRVSGYASSKIHRREIPYLRRRLGIIFQDFRLLKNRTARENVAFALEVTGTSRSAVGPKVQRTLAAVGLAQRADRFPHELSGGEQQRVAIARALVNDPFILLADEPTGNLDTKTSLEILRLLRQINSLGMAVLLATHDYTLLNDYPEARVLHLENGLLVSDTASSVRSAAETAQGVPTGVTRSVDPDAVESPEASMPGAGKSVASSPAGQGPFAAPASLDGRAPGTTARRSPVSAPADDRPPPPQVGAPRAHRASSEGAAERKAQGSPR